MDLLQLNSTRAILERVERDDGALTWYNIVKAVDRLGLETVPPVFGVLEHLTRAGLLRTEPPIARNHVKYWLTDAGRAFLR